MYNTNFICTYQLIKENDISDELYRCQFLQACNLNNWNGTQINDIIHYLEHLTKSHSTFQKALLHPCIQHNFLFLLSYPYFHITHRCLCDLISKQDIDECHTLSLFNELNKNNT